MQLVAPSGSRAGWGVVATHSNSEERARHHLIEQGFDVFLPTVLAKGRLVPLFRCYTFVWLDGERPWRPVLSTPGVWTLLRRGDGSPELARAGDIEALQAGEAVRRVPVEAAAQWAPGMACSLAGGAFRGQEGVVMEVGRHNAIIGMVVLGGLRRMSVPIEAITVR